MSSSSVRLVREHYDKNYAERQIPSSEKFADLEVTKFSDFIKATDTVLDFGCGGGSILQRLNCGTRIGIEINPTAVAVAQDKGITVFNDLSCVSDESVDVAISNHALEHTENPLTELQNLLLKLKPGASLVLCVPCDKPSFPFLIDDPDFHLFSWSANNIANLARAVGFQVIESREWVHRLPPKCHTLRRIMPAFLFNLTCVAAGALDRRRSQVRLVAKRP